MDNREIIYTRIRKDASMKDADSLCALYSKDIDSGIDLVNSAIRNTCLETLRFFDNSIHIQLVNTMWFNFKLHCGLIYDRYNKKISIDTAKSIINCSDYCQMDNIIYPANIRNMTDTFFRLVPYLYGSSCQLAITTVGWWLHASIDTHLRLYNSTKYPAVIWDSDNGDYSILESMCHNIHETMYRYETSKLRSCIEDF